jgi:hypothetical protein
MQTTLKKTIKRIPKLNLETIKSIINDVKDVTEQKFSPIDGFTGSVENSFKR